MGKKYAITDKEAMYFISFATIGWVDACLSADSTLGQQWGAPFNVFIK
jgi:hypothetical protein